MKSYKTIIFIISILLMLAALSHLLPSEGIHVEFDLTFPSLQEVLATNPDDDEEEIELPSPEDLLEQSRRAASMSKDSSFAEFCRNSPIRISLPFVHISVPDTIDNEDYEAMSDSTRAACDSIVKLPDGQWIAYHDSVTSERNTAYLDPLFQSFDSAHQKHVRIMHYGDSQLEGDRITSVVREFLQSKFGGGGPGILPAQRWVAKMTCMQSASPELPYYIAYGPASMRASHSGYGPIATVAHSSGNVRLSFFPAKEDVFPHAGQIERITVMRNATDGSGLTFQVKDLESRKGPYSVTVEGPAHIYGVMLDQKTGISMDNIPMRGSSGKIFSRIAINTIAPFFKHENVGLIILQYGGNSVPAMKSEKALHTYCVEILKQIDILKRIAPKSKIIFIGPSDMSTAIGGARITYPLLPRFVELLDQYLTQNGCAFWNMYEAMGGQGSMARWVRSQPQMAGEDHIHFTRRGAEYIGQLLCKTFETYYNYYKFRSGELDYDLPTTDYESIGITSKTPAAKPVTAADSTSRRRQRPEPSASADTKRPEPSASADTKRPKPSASTDTKHDEPSANTDVKHDERDTVSQQPRQNSQRGDSLVIRVEPEPERSDSISRAD